MNTVYIPAQGEQYLWYIQDNFPREDSFYRSKYRIIAWAIVPDPAQEKDEAEPSHSVYPVTYEDDNIRHGGAYSLILVETPDGKFDEPGCGAFSTLDDAEEELRVRVHSQRISNAIGFAIDRGATSEQVDAIQPAGFDREWTDDQRLAFIAALKALAAPEGGTP